MAIAPRYRLLTGILPAVCGRLSAFPDALSLAVIIVYYTYANISICRMHILTQIYLFIIILAQYRFWEYNKTIMEEV